MSGEIKKPGEGGVFTVHSLPDNPTNVRVVNLGYDPITMPTSYELDAADLHSLEQRSVQLLQESLGELRGRIMSNPEGEDVQEIMGSYLRMIEMTTLTDVLLVEARVWEQRMQTEDPALERIAVRTYYRIVQHENYTMCASDAFRGTSDLLARIEQGDLDSSKVAVVIYQSFVETFFRSRPDLITMEASGFRTIARTRINSALSGDADADMISHLNYILAVYAQIVFYEGINLVEIGDGIEWMESYIREGHPLEQCAKEVLISLEMTKDLLESDQNPHAPVAPTQGVVEGNDLPLTSGVIDTTKNSLSVGKALNSDTTTVIVQGSLTMVGSKIKPV